jgi:hypothetical protein
MKLYEEFKEYEDMWDDEAWEDEDELCTSYIRNVNGKDYDLTKADELRAAMEAANSDRRAMWLKGVILDGEVARFPKEIQNMAWRVWQEYKKDHGLGI